MRLDRGGHRGRWRKIARGALVAAIQLYRRWISPALPPRCRFTPTCSEYALDSILKYGAFKGSARAFLRLLKCHPLHPGGYDPA